MMETQKINNFLQILTLINFILLSTFGVVIPTALEITLNFEDFRTTAGKLVDDAFKMNQILGVRALKRDCTPGNNDRQSSANWAQSVVFEIEISLHAGLVN